MASTMVASSGTAGKNRFR